MFVHWTLSFFRPAVGEYVASLFEGGWYRAKVTSLAGDVINVWYVDYGNEATCDVTNIRRLDDRLFVLPHFAAKMAAAGFENERYDSTAGQTFAALVAENDGVFEVSTRKKSADDRRLVQFPHDTVQKMQAITTSAPR